MLGFEGDVAMFVGVLPAVDDLVAQAGKAFQKRRVGGDAVRAESGADALQGEVVLPAVVQHMQRREIEDDMTRRTLQRGQALRQRVGQVLQHAQRQQHVHTLGDAEIAVEAQLPRGVALAGDVCAPRHHRGHVAHRPAQTRRIVEVALIAVVANADMPAQIEHRALALRKQFLQPEDDGIVAGVDALDALKIHARRIGVVIAQRAGGRRAGLRGVEAGINAAKQVGVGVFGKGGLCTLAAQRAEGRQIGQAIQGGVSALKQGHDGLHRSGKRYRKTGRAQARIECN